MERVNKSAIASNARASSNSVINNQRANLNLIYSDEGLKTELYIEIEKICSQYHNKFYNHFEGYTTGVVANMIGHMSGQTRLIEMGVGNVAQNAMHVAQGLYMLNEALPTMSQEIENAITRIAGKATRSGEIPDQDFSSLSDSITRLMTGSIKHMQKHEVVKPIVQMASTEIFNFIKEGLNKQKAYSDEGAESSSSSKSSKTLKFGKAEKESASLASFEQAQKLALEKFQRSQTAVGYENSVCVAPWARNHVLEQYGITNRPHADTIIAQYYYRPPGVLEGKLNSFADFTEKQIVAYNKFAESHPLAAEYALSTVIVTIKTAAATITSGPFGGAAAFGASTSEEVFGIAISHMFGKEIQKIIHGAAEFTAPGLMKADSSLSQERAEMLVTVLAGALATGKDLSNVFKTIGKGLYPKLQTVDGVKVSWDNYFEADNHDTYSLFNSHNYDDLAYYMNHHTLLHYYK